MKIKIKPIKKIIFWLGIFIVFIIVAVVLYIQDKDWENNSSTPSIITINKTLEEPLTEETEDDDGFWWWLSSLGVAGYLFTRLFNINKYNDDDDDDDVFSI